MKKINKVLSLLCLGMIIGGCTKSSSADTFADISNSNEKFNLGKETLTAGQLYSYMRENDDSQISKIIANAIMEKALFSGDSAQNYRSLYSKYLKEYFKSTFVESDTYKYNYEFSEDILVKYLKSESYSITCDSTTDGLDTTYFSCNYSDYISKEVNYDIYMKMLKVKYILEEKTSLLDKNKARKISYFSESKNSDYTTRTSFEKYIEDIKKNYDNEEKDVLTSMNEIADSFKLKDLEKIDTEYKKLSTYDDNSSFTYLQKYTTCGNKRCSIVEGKKYQEDLINSKKYLTSEIIIKSNTSSLFEAARNILFGDNLNDYLYEVGNKKFLVSPSFDGNSEISLDDLVVYDGSDKYYLITVETIDSNTGSFEDKVSVAELLIDSVSDSTILSEYFKNINLEIYDKQIREYFIKVYGDYTK